MPMAVEEEEDMIGGLVLVISMDGQLYVPFCGFKCKKSTAKS
jgi:hypothetical protein